MAIVAIVGAATALFAAIIGFAQNDFKKVLAYSTVSQLGFMFVGVGHRRNWTAGVFHLFTHAFFKAGLFLCAGSVMHAMSGSGDITKMGGLRKQIPWTHGVFFVCWLAICGVPPFSGFFSKDAIVAGAFGDARPTASRPGLGRQAGGACCWRWPPWAPRSTCRGSTSWCSRATRPRADDDIEHHIHESPASHGRRRWWCWRSAPRWAASSACPGALFGHPEWNLARRTGWSRSAWHRDRTSTTPSEIDVHGRVDRARRWSASGSPTLFYGGGYREPAQRFAGARAGLREAGARQVPRRRALRLHHHPPHPQGLSRALFFVVDRVIIDKILVDGSAAASSTCWAASPGSFQIGDVQRYLAVFAVGVAALVYLATRPTGRPTT